MKYEFLDSVYMSSLLSSPISWYSLFHLEIPDAEEYVIFLKFYIIYLPLF